MFVCVYIYLYVSVTSSQGQQGIHLVSHNQNLLMCNDVCGRQNKVLPLDVYIQIPRACEYITLHDKGTLLMWLS